jgi:hypothetical protein
LTSLGSQRRAPDQCFKSSLPDIYSQAIPLCITLSTLTRHTVQTRPRISDRVVAAQVLLASTETAPRHRMGCSPASHVSSGNPFCWRCNLAHFHFHPALFTKRLDLRHQRVFVGATLLRLRTCSRPSPLYFLPARYCYGGIVHCASKYQRQIPLELPIPQRCLSQTCCPQTIHARAN